MVGCVGDEQAMQRVLTAATVGTSFVVVFVYADNEDEVTVEAEDQEEGGEEGGGVVVVHPDTSDSESWIPVPACSWTARVSTVKALNAHAHTNRLELSLVYNNDALVFAGPVRPQPALAHRLTVPNSSYYLYSVPPCFQADVPALDVCMPDDFLSTLDSAGHALLAPFADYTALQQHLNTMSLMSSFLIVHRHYSGWAAYTAKFVDIDDCFDASLPLFIFDYENSGNNPLFSTDESQYPDSQLPDMRLGPSMTYFLFSA